MRKKYKLKKKFVSFLLIYFILLSSYFSMITFSKYIGVINDYGTSPVAKWEVYTDTSDNESDVLNIIIGDDKTNPSYVLKITSLSDTKVMYSILLSDLPNGLEVKLDDGDYQSSINNKIEFNDVGYINANDESYEKIHTLTFNVPIDFDEIDNSEINIDVVFDQIAPLID